MMALKTFKNTYLRQTLKMGRVRPKKPIPAPLYSKLRKAGGVVVPSVFSYGKLAALVLAQMYKNNQLGDCVIAAMMKMLGIWSANQPANPYIFTDVQCDQWYGTIGGYVPGDPNTDNGCDEQTALSSWSRLGIPDGTHKIQGWIGVNSQNPAEYKEALYVFETLLAGGDIPDAYLDIAPGFVWGTGTPNVQNGHAFPFYGADASGVQVATWGMTGTMTDAAIKQLITPQLGGELYIAISQDVLNAASQKAPNAMDWPALVSEFNQVFGGSLVVPPIPPTPPTPPVPPAPPPPTPPLVQTWIDQMFQALEVKFSTHPYIVMLLKELNLWVDAHLQTQKSFWPKGFTFPTTDQKPFQRNLWAMSLDQLERIHPREAKTIGEMRTHVLDETNKIV